MTQPTCTLIAGPNGAGKTTFALTCLPDIEMSIERVAERVAHGGHDIPRESIVRRYPRGIANLLAYYAPLCSSTICVDNSTAVPEVIFFRDAEGCTVENQELFKALRREAGHD